MTSAFVPPVTLATFPGGVPGPVSISRTPRPLPVPAVPVHASGGAVYGLAVVDCHGRVAARAVLAALDWGSGQRLTLCVVGASILARPDSGGATVIGADGHLRLPVGLRRRCALISGDRVLLAAQPTTGRLLLHPQAVLDTLLPDAREQARR